MKKLFWAMVLVFCLTTSTIVHSSEISNSVDSKLPSKEIFIGKYGDDWSITIDPDLKVPRKIIGSSVNIPAFGANKTELAVRDFIVNNKKVFNLDSTELELVKQDYDTPIYKNNDGIWNIVYQQTHKGIPVYSSRIGTTINNGKIVAINSHYFPDITATTQPTINEIEALSAIGADLGKSIANPATPLKSISINNFSQLPSVRTDLIKPKDVSLIIYPVEIENTYDYHLAYKIELNTIREPLSAWVYFVDAENGQVLHKYDKVISSTIDGTVTGTVYPEHTSQTPVTVPFRHESISIVGPSTTVLYSGMEDNMTTYAITAAPINLTDVTNATLNFSTRYDIEFDYDNAFATISTNGSSFFVLKTYTGTRSSWTNESIDISDYVGQNVWIGFFYITDESVIKEGFYVEDISVDTDMGVLFFDNLESGSTNWTLSGFRLDNEIVAPTIVTTTNTAGYYNISGLTEDTTIFSEFSGPYIIVNNYDQISSSVVNTSTPPTQFNWNWSDIDTSYKKEESNVFYHANVIHDYFTKGSPFNVHSIDYQMVATVEYGSTSGNAFADGTNIYFYGAGDGYESTALLSDVIYHEYTHNVVEHVYTVSPPYSGESGALNEGWADYFAATINNNSVIAEGFNNGNPLRDINNTKRYPDDITPEVHADSLIVSGAMWDTRELLGVSLSDSLTMMAMKLEPLTFQEYLEYVLIVDDDNGNLNDGTPHINEIFTAFYTNHGIYTPYFNTFKPNASDEFPVNNSYTNISTTDVAVNITGAINVNLSSINMKINGMPVTFINTTISNGYRIQNQTTTPYNDGLYTVSVTASDNASNSLTYNWSFTIDTLSPTINTPADIEFAANSTANFTYWILYDLHPGYYWVLRNGTQIISPTPWQNNTNITVPVNTSIGLGDFNYTIQYNDSVGNYGTPDTVIVTIKDIIPPSASGENPANGSSIYNTTPLISVNITDDLSGINLSSIVMIVNDSIVDIANTAIAGGYMVYNQTVTPFTHTQVVNVTVNATDNNSNFMSYNWSFTVDSNAPVLTDTAATPQTIESNGIETTNLSVNVTDDLSGISSVTINLSSIGGAANVDMQNTGNNYWIITNATGVGNDTFYLSINATDNAGNSNTSVNITLYVNDTTSPILLDNMPITGTKALTPIISINATDIGSGINVSSANMTVNGMGVLLANTNSAFTYNFSNTTTIPYNHGDTVNVTFNVSDNEGHTSNYSWKFYIDNVTPIISITSPTDGYSTTASSITILGAVNGTGSQPVVTVNNISASTTLTNFSGTFTASVPISLGANTIYANVTDAAGNIKSTSISVTRTSPASPPPSSGGGGGGTSGEEYENIEFKDVSRVYISANTDVSFTFSKTGNDIQSINYKALTSAGYISATVEVLKNTSALVKQPPSGTVYKNMNIWLGKAGYATDHNIENPVIGFKVQKTWIQDNRIDENSIKLNRYSQDVWSTLQTTKTGEDATYIYFESQTPGFSPFAITAQEKIIPSQVSIKSDTEAETLSPVEEQPVETTTITTTTTTDSETGSVEETSIWGYLLIVALILIIASGVYLYKKKQHD